MLGWQAAAIFSLTEQKPQAGTSCVVWYVTGDGGHGIGFTTVFL